MTDDERFSLLVGLTGASDLWPVRDERIPQGVPMCAGYVPGIPRLGVPALLMSDAGLGVTNPGYRPGDTATALPAGLALAASFNPVLARSSAKRSAGRRAVAGSTCNWPAQSIWRATRVTAATSSTFPRTRC